MSWTGIKKAINRAGTQVMMKAGQIDETTDKQFEFEEKRFKAMESNSVKLHKELKQYLESLRILTTAQVNVAEVLKTFYGETDVVHERELAKEGKELRINNFSDEYYRSIKGLNDDVLSELEGPYNQVVLNPIGRFNSYFIEINEAIKKRHNKKLDYDLMKSKLQKLIEKPSNDVEDSKLLTTKEELVKSEEVYDNLNEELKTELPKLINLRIPFLNPSFESFVKLQLRFFNENYKSLNEIQSNLDSRLRQDYINGNLESRLDQVLVKMRELNVTGN
ncbi:reduced viability upon starvation protein 161 [[Candida] jaroonii]|uniref:Reduced viability upon starvation protein 161 n=1 Tax=[Candida] jaroonii TaxID=467808 RepID=A0ACA9YD90_9ASCO|nr:reduced viability upon starvation protein 161 [[Candida] jaroonii]